VIQFRTALSCCFLGLGPQPRPTMHPLPPPRTIDRSREQQSTETRPAASTMQDHLAPQSQTQSAASVPQASAGGRKKRKHRGGKKKRNRRQSFAAPSEDSTLPTLEEGPADHTLLDVPSNTSAARTPFYRHAQSSGNLSSTSLDSDVLLDHR
jgi:magnesium transporter